MERLHEKQNSPGLCLRFAEVVVVLVELPAAIFSMILLPYHSSATPFRLHSSLIFAHPLRSSRPLPSSDPKSISGRSPAIIQPPLSIFTNVAHGYRSTSTSTAIFSSQEGRSPAIIQPPLSIFTNVAHGYRSTSTSTAIFYLSRSGSKISKSKERSPCFLDDDAEVDQEITLPWICAVMAGTMRTKSTPPPFPITEFCSFVSCFFVSCCVRV
ncbi:hypothetical protein LXL04_039890 [Taraxacum kok-saghyz]